MTATSLGSNKHTARVEAFDHFKSTALYARFMWHLFRTRTSNFEAHYFSYGQDTSGHHIEKIKRLILPSPYFPPTPRALPPSFGSNNPFPMRVAALGTTMCRTHRDNVAHDTMSSYNQRGGRT